MMSARHPSPGFTELTNAIDQGSRQCLRGVSKALANLSRLRPRARRPEEEVAILFVDIVGSSRFSETLRPHKILRVLQRFHALMAALVRAHGGRIVNYTGDGLVATFGGAGAELRGPADALHCALDMLSALAAWGTERKAQGKPPIPVGIGIHYGAVVMGLIGIRGHVQRAVFGDPVNVAKRLESMTRAIGSPLVVSDEVVAAVRGGPRTDRRLLAGLKQLGPTELRGRCSPVSIWTLDAPNAAQAHGG